RAWARRPLAWASDVSETNAASHTEPTSACRDTTSPGRATSRPSTPTTRGGRGTSWPPRHSSWFDASKTKGPKWVFTKASENLPRSFNGFQDSRHPFRSSYARRRRDVLIRNEVDRSDQAPPLTV